MGSNSNGRVSRKIQCFACPPNMTQSVANQHSLLEGARGARRLLTRALSKHLGFASSRDGAETLKQLQLGFGLFACKSDRVDSYISKKYMLAMYTLTWPQHTPGVRPLPNDIKRSEARGS